MKVRGSVLEARVRFAQERGVKEFARFLTALPAGSRELVEGGIQPEAWYPMGRFHEILEVLDHQFGDSDWSFCKELGRYSCDANLSGVHRFFLKWRSIHQMIDRASNAWSVHYQGGELRVIARDERSVAVQLDLDPPHRGVCLSVMGWILRMGEHTGDHPEVAYDRCRAKGDDVCEMGFRW